MSPPPQKYPPAPVRTTTSQLSSRSRSVKISASSSCVASSTTFRTSGRLSVTVSVPVVGDVEARVLRIVHAYRGSPRTACGHHRVGSDPTSGTLRMSSIKGPWASTTGCSASADLESFTVLAPTRMCPSSGGTCVAPRVALLEVAGDHPPGPFRVGEVHPEVICSRPILSGFSISASGEDRRPEVALAAEVFRRRGLHVVANRARREGACPTCSPCSGAARRSRPSPFR